MHRWLVMGCCIAGLLAGCALSPQVVGVRPQVALPPAVQGHGRSIALDVIDRRSTEAFGARGGVYDTALIHPRTPIPDALWAVLADSLRSRGFVVGPARNGAPLSMLVEVERWDYRASGEPMINDVQLRATVRLSARRGERQVSATYEAQSQHRVPRAPEPEQNEQMLNDVLSQALIRGLADPTLAGLLSPP